MLHGTNGAVDGLLKFSTIIGIIFSATMPQRRRLPPHTERQPFNSSESSLDSDYCAGRPKNRVTFPASSLAVYAAPVAFSAPPGSNICKPRLVSVGAAFGFMPT